MKRVIPNKQLELESTTLMKKNGRGPPKAGAAEDIHGEFDPGSGRTLAACLTHASRTHISGLAPGCEWRTGA